MRTSVVLPMIALVACGDGDPPAQPDAGAPRQVVSEEKQLLVGELVEGTFEGGPGDVAMISLDAPVAKLDWNIHGHAGGGTQTIAEELEVMTARYTFAPTAEAQWLLLLRNRDAAPMNVQVTIELFGNMQWRGWQ